jgi:hypothetical protein
MNSKKLSCNQSRLYINKGSAQSLLGVLSAKYPVFTGFLRIDYAKLSLYDPQVLVRGSGLIPRSKLRRLASHYGVLSNMFLDSGFRECCKNEILVILYLCLPGLDSGSRLLKTLIFLLDPVSSTGRQLKGKLNIWVFATVSFAGMTGETSIEAAMPHFSLRRPVIPDADQRVFFSLMENPRIRDPGCLKH